ncbi:MAG: SIS domain-containing protein [Desulfovibrionaceae bacterium]
MTATDSDMLRAAREVLDIEIEGLARVRDELDGGFSRALEVMGRCKGRIVVCGIGKSGLVGRKIAATLSSMGTPAFFLHPVEGAHGDLGMLRPEDVVLALSNSGETDELNAILPALRAGGAAIVALTANEDSSLAELSDVVVKVHVPREACPMGLAPTASTTAALAVGDALSVCLMRMRGFDKSDYKRVHPGGSLGRRLALCVDEFMHTENPPLVGQGATLGEALEALDAGGFGLVVALTPERAVAGVLSDGDVRRLVCSGHVDRERPAREVMTASPRTAQAGESSASVLDVMEKHQITVLPVVAASGAFLGLVHLHDLLGKGRLKFAAR